MDCEGCYDASGAAEHAECQDAPSGLIFFPKYSTTPVVVRQVVQALVCSAGLRCKQAVTGDWSCVALWMSDDSTNTRSFTGNFSASLQKCLSLNRLFLSVGVMDDKLQ